MTTPIGPAFGRIEMHHNDGSTSTNIEKLIEDASKGIDPQEHLFALQFLDGQIKGSEWEGASPAVVAQFLSSLFTKLEPLFPSLSSEIEVMNSILPIGKDRFKETLAEITKRIRELKNGESVLLAGGWSGEVAGHSMLYRFQATAKGFDVIIFNTGNGIQFHDSIKDERKEKFYPFVYFKEVPRELVIPNESDAWLSILLESVAFKQPANYEARVLYTGCFYHFWDYKVTWNEVAAMTPQRDGVCAWKSFMAYLRFRLGSRQYKILHFYMRLLVLNSLKAARDDMTKRLFLKGANAFARETKKKLQSGLVTAEEAAFAEKVIENVQKKYALPPKVPVLVDQLKKEHFTDFNCVTRRFSPPSRPPRICSGNAPPAPLFRKEPDPATFDQDVGLLCNLVTKKFQLQTVSDYIYKIPLEKSFWDKIENKQGALENLCLLLTESLQKTETPQTLCLYYSIFIHIFEITKRMAPEVFAHFRPQSPWALVQNEVFFQPLEEKLFKQLQAISHYLHHQPKNLQELTYARSFILDDKNVRTHPETHFYTCVIEKISKNADELAGAFQRRYPKKQTLSPLTLTLTLACAYLVTDSYESMPKWYRPFVKANKHIYNSFNKPLERVITVTFTSIRFDDSYYCIGDPTGAASLYKQWWNNDELRINDPLLGRLESQDLREITALQRWQTSYAWLHRQLSWSGAHLELQPMQLLNLFHAHPSSFEDPKNIVLFWLQFFKVPATEDQIVVEKWDALLKKNPSFMSDVAKFVQGGLCFFIDLQPKNQPKIQPALFYIAVATELGYAVYSQQESEDKATYLRMLDECRNRLKACIKIDKSVYSSLLHHELMLQKCEPQKGDFDSLVTSYFMMPHSDACSAFQATLNKLLLSRLYPLLQTWEHDNGRDWSQTALTIFSHMHLSNRLPKEAKWTKTANRLFLRCDRFEIDLLSCQVYEAKEPLLPSNPDTTFLNYQSLFGNQYFTFYCQGGTDTHTFEHPIHGEMRLLQKKIQLRTQEKKIQLRTQDGWREYLDRADVMHSAQRVPLGLIAENFHHWIDEKGQLIITDLHDWQRAVAKIEGDSLTHHDQIVTDGTSISELHLFDHPRFITMYFNRQKELQSIFFVRCHSLDNRKLMFYKENGELLWGNDRRYRVDSQKPDNLLCIQEYLTMTNKINGQKKVLVPFARLDNTKHFVPEAQLRKPVLECSNHFLKKIENLPYLEFDLKEDALIPQNIEGRLYLAYLKIHERQYEKALKLLDQISAIDTLSSLSHQILDMIFEYPERSSNMTPETITLALKAAILKASHKLEEDLTWQCHAPPIEVAYKRYLDMESSVPNFLRLTRQEEAFINVKLLPKSFSERKKYLFPDAPALKPWFAERTTCGQPRAPSYLTCPRSFRRNIQESLFVEPRNFDASKSFFWSCWHITQRGSETQKARLKAFLLDGHARIATMGSAGLGEEGLRRINMDMVHFLFLLGVLDRDFRHPEPKIDKKPSFWNDADKATEEWWKLVTAKVPLWQPKTLSFTRGATIINSLQTRKPGADDLDCRDVDLAQGDGDFKEALQLFSKSPPSPLEPIAFPSVSEMHFPKEYQASIERELKSVIDDFNAGLSSKELRTLSADDTLILIERFQRKKQELSTAIQQFEEEILLLANRLPTDRSSRLHRQLDLQSGIVKNLTIWDLEKLFLSKKSALFQEANPALTSQDTRTLYNMMASWEVMQINLSRMQQILKLSEQVRRIDQEPITEDKRAIRNLLSEKIAGILDISIQEFTDEERSTYLVFNHLSQKHPRKDQRGDVAKLDQPCILNRIMGAGKTSVIAPLWGKRVADRGKMPVLFVDSSQYATLAHALKTSQKSCFDQEVFTIQLTREELTDERLAWILNTLKEGIHDKKMLILCPAMLQLLDLERFIAYKAGSKERVEKLNAILQIFKQDVVALGDEIDLILRSNKEVNLPFGEIKHISQEKIALTREIFALLCSENIVVDNQSLKEFIALETKDQTRLTQEDWKKITPLIVHHIAQHCPSLMLTERGELHASFVQFVEGDLKDSEDPFWSFVSALHNSEAAQDREAAELIALVRHLFQELLPSSFKQIGGRHFGRWRDLDHPVKTPGKVIPYEAVDTPARTEFAYHLEALVKHFMLAAQEGVEETQVLRVAEALKMRAFTSMQSNNKLLEETEEARLFKQLTGVELDEAEDKLPEATKSINASLESRLLFEEKTADHYVTFYSKRLTSTAQDFAHLFTQFSGMTGTPWNSDGYKEILADNVHLDKGTQGRINQCLLRRKAETKIETLDPGRIQEELKKFYNEEKKSFVSGIFDAGALFSKSGLSSREIATHILTFLRDHGLKQRAVLFFDKAHGSAKADQFAALIDNNGEIDHKFLESTNWDEIAKLGIHSPDEYVLFLPERQTTGTDVALPPLAEAIVTFDDTMTMRTLHQTIMRLRDFLNKQRAHFMVSASFKEKSIEYILKVALVNEAKEKADSQLRSYKQMMEAAIKDEYRKKIESRARKESDEVYEAILFPETFDDLYGQFFGIEEEIDTIQSLENLAKSLQAHFASHEDGEVIAEKLDQILQRAREHRKGFCASVKLIRNQTRSSKVAFQAEILQEAQVKQETRTQVDQKLQEELYRELHNLRSKEFRPRTEDKWYESQLEQVLACLMKGTTHAEFCSLQFACERMFLTEVTQQFRGIFESKIFATHNYLHPIRGGFVLPLFHPLFRPPGQILAVQNGDDFHFLLLSEQETQAIAARISGRKDVWLIAPSGHLFIAAASPLPLKENASLRAGLVELNILRGSISNLQTLDLMEEAIVWLHEGEKEAKITFLKMRVEEWAPEKAWLYKSSLLQATPTQATTRRKESPPPVVKTRTESPPPVVKTRTESPPPTIETLEASPPPVAEICKAPSKQRKEKVYVVAIIVIGALGATLATGLMIAPTLQLPAWISQVSRTITTPGLIVMASAGSGLILIGVIRYRKKITRSSRREPS